MIDLDLIQHAIEVDMLYDFTDIVSKVWSEIRNAATLYFHVFSVQETSQNDEQVAISQIVLAALGCNQETIQLA